MSYSFFNTKQTPCYSHRSGWQPDATAVFACTQTTGMQRQPTRRQNEDTNLFCSMKNPRKSTGNPVGTLTQSVNSVPQDMADLPFITGVLPLISTPQEPHHSPEEESFRTLLQSRLPRQRASQALRERIKNAIQQMPD